LTGCKCCVPACTHRSISKVQVTNNDLPPFHLDAKASCLDVHVIFNDGEVADLEMQMEKSTDDLKTRAAYYAAMLMAGQSQKGHKYSEIKRVYQIFFLNCILFPESNKLPRHYFYMEEEEHDRLTDVTEVIFYEMPKLEPKVQDILTGKVKINNLPEDEKWCIYMKYRHEEQTADLIKKLYRQEEGIMSAEKAVAGISRDYKKFARWMAITKNRMEFAEKMYHSKQEGLQEGLQEGQQKGRAEEKLEIARKMKEMNDSIDKIHMITGLPIETITQL